MSNHVTNPQPGDHITRSRWSDANAYEVLGRTEKTAKVRRLKATRTNRNDDNFAPGGFFGHTSHPTGQQWGYESCDTARVETIRLRKDGRWYFSGTSERPVRVGAHEHYDYNF